MSATLRFLNPSEAARQLGVSAKALRVYEQRGLVVPSRTAAGWRAYGPNDMARGAEIVALRALGLSLAQIGRVLDGEADAAALEPALAVHQALLESRAQQLADTLAKVRRLRGDLRRGQSPGPGELPRLLASTPAATSMTDIDIAFELPWPWGGEPFALRDLRPLNYIVGPLGSGKTRLALRLAEALPAAVFLGLDRLEDGHAAKRLAAEPGLRARVDRALDWLVEDGATVSDALIALLAGLEIDGPAAFVVDMVEQGLDPSTQQAVAAWLRCRRKPDGRPLFLLTRSSAILDLAAVGADAAILLCPANHSPPTWVSPYPGAPGYEAVASCLASPEVRARTQGVIAWRPALAA